MQALVNTCRTRGTGSLTELDLSSCATFAVLVAREILHDLRLAYFTPEASREAGFIETDHFGVRFPERGSHFDLTASPSGGCATCSGTTWLTCCARQAARAPAAPSTPSAARPLSWARSWPSTRPAAAATPRS